ncbi:MAG: hypothetical protein KGO22_02475 [Gammaproteobacteria bacterium]|nr:hypothetical protein [Gammaproteobacteria bacterium]
MRRSASFRLAAALALAVLCTPPSFARSLAVASPVVNVTFDGTGVYEVHSLGARWNLRGQLGDEPKSLTSTSGTDRLGAWREVEARTGAEVAAIRVYEKEPVVLFRDERIRPAANREVFPVFEALPAGLMKLGYGVDTFAKYEFGSLGAQGPWVLFDAAGRAMVLAPTDHFLAAGMTDGPGGADAGGIDPKITMLPAGFEHDTMLVLGQGIGTTLDAWGHALQVLNGKRPVANDADVLLSKFGYWTDNGSTYYYKFVPSLGYEGTLLAVRDAYRKLGLPLAYMQLDSWWYPKEKGNSLAAMAVNGETVYRASPEIFPQGLRAFQQEMGLPLVVHARWVAADSPYRREYEMSHNVVLSPAFWKSTASYLHDGGVAVYEQDWLNENARPAVNLTDPRQFLGNMAGAMGQEGIAIQYCMPLPGYFLASTRYQSLETIRVSDDRFQRSRWDAFLYGSALARAVGLWPWSDVFMSRELPQLILATLSAGPVGVGDALGQIDASNLKKAMRTDSVLLKPDVAAEPIDAVFVSDAQSSLAPMVAATRSRDEREVFAYPRADSQKQVTVSLRQLGVQGPAYEWDWVRQEGTRVPAGGSFSMVFQDGWAYAVVTPIGKDGMGILGDTDRIVPLARARFPVVTNSTSAHVTITYAPGEDAVQLRGYAAGPPSLRVVHGSFDSMQYSAATHLFRAIVHPPTAGAGARTAELVIQNPGARRPGSVGIRASAGIPLRP